MIMDKEKLKEIFLYLVFGVLATIVCLVTYYGLVLTVLDPENPIQLQTANIISWLAAVLFAYFTNRNWVFQSQEKNVAVEMAKFFGARIFSLLLDMAIMLVFVSVLKMNDKIIKLASQVVVVVTNYLLSKLFVFKKDN